MRLSPGVSTRRYRGAPKTTGVRAGQHLASRLTHITSRSSRHRIGTGSAADRPPSPTLWQATTADPELRLGQPARSQAQPAKASGRAACSRHGAPVLDERVGGRKEHALVAIAPADTIRWRAVFAVHLYDHSLAICIAHVMSLDHQLIASTCSHHVLPGLHNRIIGLQSFSGNLADDDSCRTAELTAHHCRAAPVGLRRWVAASPDGQGQAAPGLATGAFVSTCSGVHETFVWAPSFLADRSPCRRGADDGPIFTPPTSMLRPSAASPAVRLIWSAAAPRVSGQQCTFSRTSALVTRRRDRPLWPGAAG